MLGVAGWKVVCGLGLGAGSRYGSEPDARVLRRKKRDPSASSGQAASRGSLRFLTAQRTLVRNDNVLTRLAGASYFFVWNWGLGYEAEGGSVGGAEFEGLQTAGGVGGALLHDDGGGVRDESFSAVWRVVAI